MSYSINGTDFQSDNIFSGLSPNNYTITVRDENNCEVASTPITIANTAGPAIDNVAEVKATCGADNASMTVTASGGTGDLEYSIDGTNFQPSNQFTLLPEEIIW